MKKTKLLNSEISYVISKMGHFDTITISDCGLPIPSGVKRIDLAVTLGIPCFRDVFYTVLEELEVQKAYIASEMKEENLSLYAEMRKYFDEHGIAVKEVPHEVFKSKTRDSKAVIRSGEITPYANVILESNVVF